MIRRIQGSAALSICLACCSAAALSACSTGTAPPHLTKDGGVSLPDYGDDGAGLPDYFTPPPDLGQPDAACTLGTATNCGYCGEACPPGQETSSTAPVCLDKKCSIQCKGEYYDVNADPKDGCETQDDLPVHDDATSAYDIGKASDCDDSKSATGVIPSDDRKHLISPVDRLNGRDDWFKLHIDDKFGCIVNAEVKVSLTGLPTGASYRAVAHWVCDDGNKQLAADSKLGNGGAQLSLAPSTGCTTMGDDSGTLYIKVSKESGTHSTSSYSIDITP